MINKDPIGEVSFELDDNESQFDINIEELKDVDLSDSGSVAELVGCMNVPSEPQKNAIV